ncbi:hypothetical protein [Phenylobacterium zucineum]|uniref:hypothetical protein n=1 Tax=Phenylobacterium zucineum TaxID=284016 RepID=UPI00059C5088|nr:hypothetical protein [Phenylobacterium zucineum]
MAEVHPYVQDLLSPLLRSRLAAVGEVALSRLVAAETAPEREIEGMGARPDETAGDRGRRQLELADRVVAGALKRELLLFERTLELLRRIGADQRQREEVRLESIRVGDDGDRAEDLITGARRAGLQTLLTAWRKGVEVTRERLAADGD